METGSTLAGEIEVSPVFQSSYKPCITTLEQLESSAAKRNKLFLAMTKSSGDAALDRAVLAETREEIGNGWGDGPWELSFLEYGSPISGRFPLVQDEKIRMIDDYSVSGVNDSCTVHTKLDLHAVDTFIAVVKAFFEGMDSAGKRSELLAKTYDLKSAYRQIPVRVDRLCFAYFSKRNCETCQV